MAAPSNSSTTDTKTFLGNIPIAWRIGFLIALGLIALITVEIVTSIGDRRLEKANSREESFSMIEVNVLKADVGALMLRRREKDFLIRKDPNYFEKYLEDHAKTLSVLESIKTEPEAESALTDLDAIIAKLNEHKDQFRKVVEMTTQLGLNEKSGNQGRLRKAVHSVETRLKELKNDSLTVKMLMMRRHEKDFMLRGDAKYIDRISKRRSEFDQLLAASEIPESAKADIASLMDQYQAEMKAFAGLTSAMGPEIKRLSTIYKEMKDPVNALHKFAANGLNLSQLEAQTVAINTSRGTLIAAIGIGVLLLILGVLVMRSLTGPISRITRVTTQLSEGQLDVVVPATDNTDEMGAMARALLVFRDNLAETEQLRIEQAESEERSLQQRRDTRMRMANDFEGKVGSIAQAVSSSAMQMQSSAQTLNSSSENTALKAGTVASAAESASANVETVATAAEELSASISEISRQVAQSSEIASSAVTEAEHTNEQVRGLAESANKIGEVVNLISDIAEQTNLLALNATIEAARAGEAGKGFAVVASEVKNLANQTAKATEDISSQVGGIQSATQEAVGAIGGISATIGQINEIAATIAAAVEEQGAATSEIARNVQQASSGTQEVTNNIGDVTQAATENGVSTKQLLNASTELSQQAERLSEEVNAFLADIRAG